MSVENELALRLAGYVQKHGPIPNNEIFRLARIGHGLGHKEADLELAKLAREILEYLVDLSGSGSD